MKLFKRLFALFLVIAALLSAFSCSKNQPADDPDAVLEYLSVSPYPADRGCVIFANEMYEGKYYLFMPAAADYSSLVFDYPAGAELKCGDTQIPANTPTGEITGPGAYTLSFSQREYVLTVIACSEIPSVFIETESGRLDYIHEDKNNKESGTLTVYENGVKTDEAELKYIKGRGNTTWNGLKRPYNIKFEEKKSFLGMSPAKKWALLANAYDDSLLRNEVCLNMLADAGLEYTSEHRLFDLYIGGDYRGCYLAAENVETGKNRVEITDLDELNEEANPGTDIEKLNVVNNLDEKEKSGKLFGAKQWVDIKNSPDDISGGYLIELESNNRTLLETSWFISSCGQGVNLKTPEYATKSELDYISAFYDEAEAALYSYDGYNSLGRYYTEYFDMDSLVTMYVVQEYVCNIDAGKSSCFFYLDKGEKKFKAGPGWDFDMSCWPGIRMRSIEINESQWGAAALYNEHSYAQLGIFAACFMHPDFRAAASEKWRELREVLSGEDTIEGILDLVDFISDSALCDYYRWAYFYSDNTDTMVSVYCGRMKDSFKSSFESRAKSLDEYLTPDAAMVYYVIPADGYTVTLPADLMRSIGDEFTADGMEYADNLGILGPCVCWNTKSDGSGTDIYPGDTVVLDSPSLYLYPVASEGGK